MHAVPCVRVNMQHSLLIRARFRTSCLQGTEVIPAGAHTNVCLTIDIRRLNLLGADGAFTLQPGHYKIYMGGSCPGTLGAYVN